METNKLSAAITAAWEENAAAGRALSAARAAKQPTGSLYIRVKRAGANLDAQQDAARKAFAKSRGWRLAKYSTGKGMGDGCDVLHHLETYHDANGEKIALVGHTYLSMDRVASYAVKHGLIAEPLKWSWWAPGLSTAVLFTRKAGATWPK
jgi:hypothetical protein